MFNENFYAIIVTYNPDVKIIFVTVNNLIKQGFSVIIIDNNSKNFNELSEIKNVTIVRFSSNFGIAFALNEGMKLASELNAQWVLTLDQDSLVADNLLEVYKNYLNLPHIGALCPFIKRVGYRQQTKVDNFPYIIVERAPTTGFFQSVISWKTVGGYDEWMFIDYVDYDMSIRLKVNNFLIYKILDTYVIQNLGHISYCNILFSLGCFFQSKKLLNFSTTYNHSPDRNYFFVRNCLFFIYKYRLYINVKSEFFKLLKWEVKKLMLEKNKIKTLLSIIHGIRDFINKVEKMK